VSLSTALPSDRLRTGSFDNADQITVNRPALRRGRGAGPCGVVAR
jgi:hypothetical protein